MIVLGLSGGFHDSAAALVVGGQLVAAVEQERLSRRKHDAAFPVDAALTCLRIAGVEVGDVDLVACHEKPLDVADRHLSARLSSGPQAMWPLLRDTPHAIRTQLATGSRVQRLFRSRGASCPPIAYVPHHVSHAAAAFYPSPFDDAAIVTVDGVGEWSTASLGHGHAHRLQVEQELAYPDSVGLLYSAFTSYCGMRVNGGEGELMGLAPFGRPIYADQILSEVVDLRSDGSIGLDLRYFRFHHGRSMTSPRFHRRFGGPPHPLGAEPGQRQADLAASIQVVVEQVVLAMANEAHRRTGSNALVLGGGVALNCVANARVRRDGPFERVWVQPAPGDAGAAIGAALWTWHEELGHPRAAPSPDGMQGAFLGPAFGEAEIDRWVQAEGLTVERFDDHDHRARSVAERLAAGDVVGWFTGRMEFGPRALGHRSILADPRPVGARERLNRLVKERAPFRPFAPAVLSHRAEGWFSGIEDQPYMTFTSQVASDRWIRADTAADASIDERLAQPNGEIAAVTHVDGSARAQTVDPDRNPELTALLEAFDALTGCPVLLNTSFNARDEPIVCTPDDALATFRRTGLDLLVVEHVAIERER